MKRSTTFAGMDSYYKKSKTFHYGQSPQPKLRKIEEDEPDAEGLIELQVMKEPTNGDGGLTDRNEATHDGKL